MNNHSRALSFQDACIAVAKQILPINIDKNMIQTQKKRLNNTCKLSMFAREKSNSLHSCLVHFMEKVKFALWQCSIKLVQKFLSLISHLPYE